LAGVGTVFPITRNFTGFTNNTERLRITDAGLVGIGTSSVASTLHIVDSSSAANGTIRLGGGSAFPGYNSTIQQDGQTTGKLLFNSAATAGTGHGHQFQVDGTAAVTIDASRRVGIGTTSPLSPLAVSNGSNKNIEFQPGSTCYLLAYDRTASDYLDLDITAKNLIFSTNNGTERARIAPAAGS
jgi:hypothetical protein